MKLIILGLSYLNLEALLRMRQKDNKGYKLYRDKRLSPKAVKSNLKQVTEFL